MFSSNSYEITLLGSCIVYVHVSLDLRSVELIFTIVQFVLLNNASQSWSLILWLVKGRPRGFEIRMQIPLIIQLLRHRLEVL
jgi:hypothetical protein